MKLSPYALNMYQENKQEHCGYGENSKYTY